MAGLSPLDFALDARINSNELCFCVETLRLA
jgi:hypothetical protein